MSLCEMRAPIFQPLGTRIKHAESLAIQLKTEAFLKNGGEITGAVIGEIAIADEYLFYDEKRKKGAAANRIEKRKSAVA